MARRQQEMAAGAAAALTREEMAERLELRNREMQATWAVEHGLYCADWEECR